MKTILVDAVNTFILKDHGIFQEMFDLLETYENPKIILTNANDEQIKIFGLDKVPYSLFTLKHDPEKTDSEYFKIFMKEKGLTMGDVVYVEHNKDAVESAKSVGIASYYYNPEEKDLKALKIFLDDSLRA